MAITSVLPTDTPNAGRVKWNDSDTSLQAEIDAEETALVTHKTSSDHDGSYYTETEIDTLYPLPLTNTQIGLDAIEADNISHDNNRTKFVLTITVALASTGAQYVKFGEVIMTATLGIPFKRPRAITGFTCCEPGGAVTDTTAVYSTGASNHFAADDRLQIFHLGVTNGGNFQLRKNGSAIASFGPIGPGTPATGDYIFTIEGELDD